MIEQTHTNKHGWQLALDLEITEIPRKDEDKEEMLKKIKSNEIFDLLCSFLGDKRVGERPVKGYAAMQFTEHGWIVLEPDLTDEDRIFIYLTLNQSATDEDQTEGLSRLELREQREFRANKLKGIETIFEEYYGGRVFSRTYFERLK